MKYADGTITLIGGSDLITGTGTAWAGRIQAGDLLTITELGEVYPVATVISDTILRLARPVEQLPDGAIYAGFAYCIARDFTVELDLPMPRRDDIDKAGLLNRAFTMLDVAIALKGRSSS